MFSSSNLQSFVPLFPKDRLTFPCSLRYFANVQLFPKTPVRPSTVNESKRRVDGKATERILLTWRVQFYLVGLKLKPFNISYTLVNQMNVSDLLLHFLS